MPADDIGKEPGNWELYRGIERVEQALREGFAGTVSQAVYSAEKQATNERIDNLGGEVAEIKSQQLSKEAATAVDKKLAARFAAVPSAVLDAEAARLKS